MPKQEVMIQKTRLVPIARRGRQDLTPFLVDQWANPEVSKADKPARISSPSAIPGSLGQNVGWDNLISFVGSYETTNY